MPFYIFKRQIYFEGETGSSLYVKKKDFVNNIVLLLLHIILLIIIVSITCLGHLKYYKYIASQCLLVNGIKEVYKYFSE